MGNHCILNELISDKNKIVKFCRDIAYRQPKVPVEFAVIRSKIKVKVSCLPFGYNFIQHSFL